jgi:aminomethyltransferase
MAQKTALYNLHCQLGGQMVDFAGWQMPLNFGSQIAEHHAVRQRAGMFDVSHMGIVDIHGADAAAFLRYALANDVKKLDKNGKALYSCLLNARGGVIDDLIAYRLEPEFYRLVINASRREVDLAWLNQLSAAYQVRLELRQDLAIVAVQGPHALLKVSQLLLKPLAVEVNALRSFQCLVNAEWQISRTGYTGEDGVEIILPIAVVAQFWQDLLACDVQPCGLGARDTLRLEAGLNLYGADMDETTTPMEANLEWTVAWLDSTRNFVGKQALAKQKQQGVPRQLVGLIMEEAGVLRNHQQVWINNAAAGEITSGSFSPTLGCAIAMARLELTTESVAQIERRGKKIPVRIVQLPFLKQHKNLNQQTIKENT